jgi:hypothetical protein
MTSAVQSDASTHSCTLETELRLNSRHQPCEKPWVRENGPSLQNNENCCKKPVESRCRLLASKTGLNAVLLFEAGQKLDSGSGHFMT